LEGIFNKTPSGECTTGPDGKCEIFMVPAGALNITVTDNRFVEKFEKMSYLLPSVSEVKSIGEGLSIALDGDKEVKEPLGVGFFTKPFSVKIEYKIKNYFDLDKSPCPTGSNPHFCDEVRDWNNGQQTYDDHTGIDFNTRNGTPILAVAPGTITHVGAAELSGNWGNYIEISHYSNFKTYYGHMSLIEVKEGDLVERGQEIGKVGSTGASSEPHLHLELKRFNEFVDFYKDVLNNSSMNYWTKLNEPISPY
jgi:murein DD-endopeptidase MepM/ murein hydrolase activator NlpD